MYSHSSPSSPVLVCRIIICLVLCFFLKSSLLCQWTINWDKSYGGTGLDWANDMTQTQPGVYVLAGWTASLNGDVSTSFGAHDFWLICLDSMGTLLWQNSYGGSQDEEASSVILNPDGSFTACGFSESSDGNLNGNKGMADYWIIHADAGGILLWQKNYGGSSNDKASAIVTHPGGGYFVIGKTNSFDGDVTGNHGGFDFWLLRLNYSGDLLWQKTYGGSSGEWGYDIAPAPDGNFILTGSAKSYDGDVSANKGDSDFWIVKIDTSGSILWEKNYGGSYYEYSVSVLPILNGEYIFSGYTASVNGDVSGNKGGQDIWTIKTDALGNLLWASCIGGSYDDYMNTNGTALTADGNLLLTGVSYSKDGDAGFNQGSSDYFLVKMKPDGTILWAKTFGGTNSDAGTSAISLPGEKYLISGTSASTNGDITSNHGSYDFWMFSFSPSAVSSPLPFSAMSNSSKIFPNPSPGETIVFNPFLSGIDAILTFNLYDIKGTKILSFPVKDIYEKLPGEKPLSKGIYFYTVEDGGGIRSTGKLIMQ